MGFEALSFGKQMNAGSKFANALVAQGADHFADALHGIEDAVVEEVNKIIRSEFINDRPDVRRKSDSPLLGSIEAEVIPHGDSFPITVRVWSTTNQKKAGALEFGSPSHLIAGVNGKGGRLYFPSSIVNKKTRARGVFGREYQAHGGAQPGNLAGFGRTSMTKGAKQVLAKPSVVHHPGGKAHQFMQRGLKRAVEAKLRGAR